MWASAPTRRCKSVLHSNRAGACRAKRSARRVAPKFCRSAVRSSNVCQISKTPQARTRVLTKPVSTLVSYCTSNLELPGFQKGRGPFVFRAAARPKQLLPGGSTRRFFAQLRSVGSKKDQLASPASNPLRSPSPSSSEAARRCHRTDRAYTRRAAWTQSARSTASPAPRLGGW